MEIKDWDGAISTIKQCLSFDSDNPQLQKLLRTVKQSKKAAANAAAKTTKPTPRMDALASNEFSELQQQYVQTNREFNIVKANILRAQRECKSQEITKSELEKLNETKETTMYRSVGKMFLRSSREQVFEHLEKTIEDEKKRESDLTQKLEYLERRMKSQRQNMEEVMRSPSSAE
jgi:chaperonin cofactor prefoldin